MPALPSLDDRRDFLHRCTRCSQCKFVPAPKSQRHASACPSIDFGQYHAYSGGGQVILAAALQERQVDATPALLDAVSACTMCGACDVSCKVNFAETVEPMDSLYALRAHLARQGQVPPAWQTQIERLRRCGNAAGHPRADRGRWADGLTSVRPGQPADVVLHIGSTLAYDTPRHATLGAIVQGLARAGVRVSHLGVAEGSSGSLAFDLGFVDDARALAQALADAVTATGAGTLVTFSAPALAAFRSVYPRLGVSFGTPARPVRVLHITEYLQELVDAGRLALQSVASSALQAVAYHDACKLGRQSEPWQPHDTALDRQMSGLYTSRAPQALRFGHGGCYEAPRALLRAMGLQVHELERHHEASYCCGACGGVPDAQPDAATLAARHRLAELHDTPVRTLVSACSGCSRHLGQHTGGSAQVLDLLDLLARALQPAPVAA